MRNHSLEPLSSGCHGVKGHPFPIEISCILLLFLAPSRPSSAMSWGQRASEASPRRSTPSAEAELLRQLQRKEADATKLTERVQPPGSGRAAKRLGSLRFFIDFQ